MKKYLIDFGLGVVTSLILFWATIFFVELFSITTAIKIVRSVSTIALYAIPSLLIPLLFHRNRKPFAYIGIVIGTLLGIVSLIWLIAGIFANFSGL
ncbi:MAG: hypothetical protein Q8Q32_00995 [bacterium]|nr:hypothetical protein [bacterium]